jgi:phosphatidylglycerophosphatase A
MGAVQVNRFRGNRWLRGALRAVATGFGAGFCPVAPGTAGTLVALPLWYWSGGWGARHFLLLGAILLVSIPSVKQEVESTGNADPGSVVIDEIAGMLLAATAVPWSLRSAVILFLLFRLFDIVKFGPAAWLDRRKGAVFVVADDLAAGLYAAVAYRGITWLTG